MNKKTRPLKDGPKKQKNKKTDLKDFVSGCIWNNLSAGYLVLILFTAGTDNVWDLEFGGFDVGMHAAGAVHHEHKIDIGVFLH